MATLLAFANAVDIGHGRGRLAAPAAASVRRIDAQLGRPADVNEGWRSPDDANANRARWIAYQNGTGPVAPYALGAEDSIHCRGFAADSDDWYNSWAAGVWYHNGWRQTARYPGSNRDEPWHGEYFAHLDLNSNGPAAGGATDFIPGTTITLEDIMAGPVYIWSEGRGGALIDPSFGGIKLAGEEAIVALEVFGGKTLSDRAFDVALNLAIRLAEIDDAALLAEIKAQFAEQLAALNPPVVVPPKK